MSECNACGREIHGGESAYHGTKGRVCWHCSTGAESPQARLEAAEAVCEQVEKALADWRKVKEKK